MDAPSPAERVRSFFLGLAVGAGLSLLAAALGHLLLGWQWTESEARPVGVLWMSILNLSWLVVLEELAFRGPLFAWMEKRWGAGMAEVGTSLAFAAYATLTGWSIGSAVTGPLVGGWILAKLRSGSGTVWCSIGAHLAWSAIQDNGPLLAVLLFGRA
ncbi:MAG: CPBP family intramembrane metalloprotease [Acidobacteria bacterium]|nr:CPBP family intramembrane metalloprotease [Acidobacteriota bacterium]